MDRKVTSKEIMWRAAEYEHPHRDGGWYIAVLIITILLLAFAIWQKSFLFAVFIIIAGGLLITSGRREPDILDFRVSGTGVTVGKEKFDYEVFEHYSIKKRHGRLDEIIFRRKIRFNPFLRVPADSDTAEKARKILKEHVPEVEHEDSFIEILAELFGL